MTSTLRVAYVAVLNAIYEHDFLGFSYGFRPKPDGHLLPLCARDNHL